MNNIINSETIKQFFEKLAKLFNSFFPGIVILELFFRKGYFSDPPKDWFTFFLYIIWSGILSIPIHYIQPMSIQNFFVDIYYKVKRRQNKDDQQIEKPQWDKVENYDYLKEEFQLGFIVIELFFLYVVFKIILFFNVLNFVIIGIPPNIIELILSFLAIYLIGYPVGIAYSELWTFRILKLSDKRS